MTPEEHARNSWQSEKGVEIMPTIEELRARTKSLQRRIWLRNTREYVLGLISVAVIVAIWRWSDTPLGLFGVGSVLLVGGIFVSSWQLHRRTAPLSLPNDSGKHAVLDCQRQELVRQRDALKSIFYWSILPVLPGILVMTTGPLLEANGPQGLTRVFAICLSVFFAASVLWGVWWLNQRGARKFEKQIDEIDALRTE